MHAPVFHFSELNKKTVVPHLATIGHVAENTRCSLNALDELCP